MMDTNGQSQEQPVILIVDDNTINLQLLYETLDGHGYQLLAARPGEEALRIARKATPDLILLDIMMPGIDKTKSAAQRKAGQFAAIRFKQYGYAHRPHQGPYQQRRGQPGRI